MNPPLSANSPTAVLSGLAIGGHIHNSIDTIRMLLPCLAFHRPVFVFVVFFFHLTTLHRRRPFHHHLTKTRPDHHHLDIILTGIIKSASTVLVSHTYAPMIHA